MAREKTGTHVTKGPKPPSRRACRDGQVSSKAAISRWRRAWVTEARGSR